MGNMVQSNSISGAFVNAFPQIKPIYVGIVCAIISAFIFIGGFGRINSFSEKKKHINGFFFFLCFVFNYIINI